MKPSIGRIVHHRESPKAACQAAIVVAVGKDSINEVLFRDGSNDSQQAWAGVEAAQWRTGVPFEEDAEASDGPTWHWPEREDEADTKAEAKK